MKEDVSAKCPRKESYSILLLVRAFLFEKIKNCKFLKMKSEDYPVLNIWNFKNCYKHMKRTFEVAEGYSEGKREVLDTQNLLGLCICSYRSTFVMWSPA